MIAYGTDSPIYHRPLATIGLIGLCCLLYFTIPSNPSAAPVERVEPPPKRPVWDDAAFAAPNEAAVQAPVAPPAHATKPWPSLSTQQLRVQFGRLNPLQWLTGPLLHSGIFSLLLNMIALWALGLVVEGKVGSRTFLMLFFTMAVGQAALLQLLMLFNGDGSYAGSGAALMGLLGIAIIWAPKNNLDVWFGPYLGTHEVPILVYAFLLLALNGLTLGLNFDFLASLLGLGFGLALGFQWLKSGWVDCEGWDLLSVLKNEHISPRKSGDAERLEEEARALVQASIEKHRPSTMNKKQQGLPVKTQQTSDKPHAVLPGTRTSSGQHDVEQLIFEGHYQTALKMISRLAHSGTQIELAQPALAKLMRGLLSLPDYANAIPIMQQHIERFDTKRSAVQLNLVKVYLHLECPQKALNLLETVDRGKLDEKGLSTVRALIALARQQIEEGVIELSD